MREDLLRVRWGNSFLYFVSKVLQLQYMPVKKHVKTIVDNSFMKLTDDILYCSVDKIFAGDKM